MITEIKELHPNKWMVEISNGMYFTVEKHKTCNWIIRDGGGNALRKCKTKQECFDRIANQTV